MTLAAKKRGPSGEHAAVKAYRAKLDSISEIEAPGGQLDRLGQRIDAQLARLKSDRPKDPRREDDAEVPVDVVDIHEEPTLRVLPPSSPDPVSFGDEEPDPFPQPRKKK